MQSRPIEEFWLEADGDDWAPAFRRAQLTMPAGRSLKILLGNRTYICATALKFWRPVHVEGVEDSILSFTSDSHGIITCYAGTNLFETHTTSASDPATVDGTIGDTADAAGVTLKSLTLKGTSATSSTLSHGAVLLTQTILEDVTIKDFSGHGIYSCVTTSGSAPSALADINTIATFLGVFGDSVIRDCILQDTGRYSINIRNTGTASPILTNTKCSRAGTSFFSVIHTTGTAITPSSATFSSGSVAVTMSGAGHGFSTGDYAILSGIGQSSVDYNLRCYEISKTSVSGSTVTCPVATTANPAWPTSSTATFSSTTRVARLYSYAPSSVTFSTSGGINVATLALGGAHIFKPNDYVIMQNVSSSSNDKAYSSPRYPRPCRVVSVTSTDIVVAPPTGMTFPGSSTATLDSDPRVCGFEMNIVLNTSAPCAVRDLQCDTPVLGALQLLDESSGTVHVSHYDKGGITRSQHNNAAIVLAGSNLNNTGADKQRSTAAIVKPGGSGILEVQKAVAAYPNYKDYGVKSILGGVSKESILEANINYNGTAVHTNNLALQYGKSTTAKGGGYVEFTNNTGTNGYTSIALPTINNNRNNKAPLLPGGVYIGGFDAGDSYASQTSLSAVPKSYTYLGTEEIDGTNDKYTQFLFSSNNVFKITNITNSSTNSILTTSAAHGFATTDRIMVSGVSGPPSVNGIWNPNSVAAATTFQLNGTWGGGSAYATYSATISATAAGISDGSSDVTTTVITVTSASGTVVAGDRLTVGSTAANADALVVNVSGSNITVQGDYTGLTGTVTKNAGQACRVHAIAYGSGPPRDSSTGVWGKGDIIYNTTPNTSYIEKWICSAGGTGSTSTWVAVTGVPYLNGSRTATLYPTYEIRLMSSATSGSPSSISIAPGFSDGGQKADLVGQRVLVNGHVTASGTVNGAWIISANTASAITLLGSTTFTSGTNNTGCATLARAETTWREPPRDGTWAGGDVCINASSHIVPISRWVCSAASAAIDDGATWTPIMDLPYTNGSQVAHLQPISPVYKISTVANDGGGEIRITTPTHVILDGQRILVSGTNPSSATVNGVWIVKDRSSTTMDLTGSTHANSYASNRGSVVAARAITHTAASPADGTWAIGDIAYNSGPVTAGILGWVCTASGAPGTWKTIYYTPEAQLDSSLTYSGSLRVFRAALAAGGVTGTGDEVTLLDTSPGLPQAIRILETILIVSTNIALSTCTLQDSDSNALSDAISSAATGTIRSNHTATATVAAAKGLKVVRSDRAVVGEIIIHYIIT